MTTADWRRVIVQIAELGAEMIQFIGGEPTLHPDLPDLVEHALDHGLLVEVYTNLVHVTDRLWALFRRRGVSLATSYYSDNPAEHQRIVGGNKHAHRQTLANIGLARAYGIPIRAGLISFTDQQRVGPARQQLARLGVTRTGVDHVRGVGRGTTARQEPNIDALCGQCANGKIAILPTGEVFPCVFSRWPAMLAGNVLEHPLANILTDHPLTTTRTQLQTHFHQRPRQAAGRCDPDVCQPGDDGCTPVCAPNFANEPARTPTSSATDHCLPGADTAPAAQAFNSTREFEPEPRDPHDGGTPGGDPVGGGRVDSATTTPLTACEPRPCGPDVCDPGAMCAPDDPCGPNDGCAPDCAPVGGCLPGACDPACLPDYQTKLITR
jgi:MoaA/NifB/PqqE/SkfB family radical SAM enzyme